jgi:hypothetical protein
MRSLIIIALAVALLLAGSELHFLWCISSDYCADFNFHFQKAVAPTALTSIPHLILGKTSKDPPDRSHLGSQGGVYRKGLEARGLKLSVFKGREAKLNCAIFLALFQSGPLVVYDITKDIRKCRGFRKTKYTNVNRRVRALVVQGYLEIVGSREIQSGSRGALYQPTIRATVAFYQSKISRDQFVREAHDDALTTELAAIALFLGKDRS